MISGVNKHEKHHIIRRQAHCILEVRISCHHANVPTEHGEHGRVVGVKPRSLQTQIDPSVLPPRSQHDQIARPLRGALRGVDVSEGGVGHAGARYGREGDASGRGVAPVYG